MRFVEDQRGITTMRENRPCSGSCTPSGQRSCTKRSVHPRGTTERLQLRKIQPEQSSTGGACFDVGTSPEGQHTDSAIPRR